MCWNACALTLHRHCEQQFRSPLCVMYLDHVSVGGSAEDMLHDLDIIKAAKELGLFFNNNKSEIICNDALSEGNHHHCSPRCYGSRPREDLFAWITSGGCRFHRHLLGREDTGSEYHGFMFFSLICP